MAERKVLNKYFPPDFDPSKVAKREIPDNARCMIRMMLPMNVKCTTCGEFMYRGTKFNTPKEEIEDENYLGIVLHRFYFKCRTCCSYFSIRTDPQNADYIVEKGATRNFEPWKDSEMKLKEFKKAREEEEEGNKMKQLENRTEDSKREMDILDALAEIKEANTKIEATNVDKVIQSISRQKSLQQKGALSEEEIERMNRLFVEAAQRKQDEKDRKMLNLTEKSLKTDKEFKNSKENIIKSKNLINKRKFNKIKVIRAVNINENNFKKAKIKTEEKFNENNEKIDKNCEKNDEKEAKISGGGLDLICQYSSDSFD